MSIEISSFPYGDRTIRFRYPVTPVVVMLPNNRLEGRIESLGVTAWAEDEEKLTAALVDACTRTYEEMFNPPPGRAVDQGLRLRWAGVVEIE